MYASDSQAHGIYRIDANGTLSIFAGTGTLQGNGNALGKRRARNTCATLAGGHSIRTYAITQGEANPDASNKTAAGRAQNRRADIALAY
ncbi:hypothetical protein GCM10010435_07890 [Winogradskya consettensis]|uniref:OmpA-like domain-containing protein n=1 Tax=Winogradskya consettensis TaxID=113560 RepID=A0A919SX30_9ACTN|nr:hypothetical protein [Actinoplanes consettensis]GIM80415.1 hypothetical protein Aco04nite_70610 [Actinoplanes consettensis]